VRKGEREDYNANEREDYNANDKEAENWLNKMTQPIGRTGALIKK
jgi:hypothetical protein